MKFKETKDIGFGTKGGGKGRRLLNANGSFNVRKLNTKFDVYHKLVTCSTIQFVIYVLTFYCLLNSLFAILYNLNGIQNLAGIKDEGVMSNFLSAFFFSVQTFTTVGYGAVHPVGHIANLIASTEALFGILSVSVVSGILFGRFTQKREAILFSDKAIVTDLRGQRTFQFRIANKRSSELIELNARCVCSLFDETDGERKRGYFTLDLERSNLMLFPLNWTIVHPIVESSPFYNLSHEDLIKREIEIIVLISGFDDSAKQIIYSKHSFIARDIYFDHKFIPAYKINEEGETVFDLKEINQIVKH